MGFLKSIIKNVASDYVPDFISDAFDDDDEELDDEDFDEEEEDEEEEDKKKKRKKKDKKNALQTPPPPGVPRQQESLSVMVAVNGESYGPYEKVTLIEMIKNGSLTRETYVFINGMNEWRVAKDVPQVASLFAPEVPKPAAPPVPWANPSAAPAPAPAKHDNGFSSKLNSLIESAVADGEISDLERQVLVRNAQAEGVAMDEFVMVLEARLYERRQELMRMQKEEERKAQPQIINMPPPTPKTEVHSKTAPSSNKCPHCGAPVKQLATTCPDCGYEYPVGMGGYQGTASERLAKAIDDARRQAEQAKNNKRVGVYSAVKSFVDRSMMKDSVVEAHSITIKNFPVPTNKSDILDLFSTCAANSKYGVFTDEDEKQIAKAYKNKASEILIKARIVAKDDKEFLSNLESIAKKYKIKA